MSGDVPPPGPPPVPAWVLCLALAMAAITAWIIRAVDPVPWGIHLAACFVVFGWIVLIAAIVQHLRHGVATGRRAAPAPDNDNTAAARVRKPSRSRDG